MIIFGHVRSPDSLDVIWTCSHVAMYVAVTVIFPDARHDSAVTRLDSLSEGGLLFKASAFSIHLDKERINAWNGVVLKIQSDYKWPCQKSEWIRYCSHGDKSRGLMVQHLITYEADERQTKHLYRFLLRSEIMTNDVETWKLDVLGVDVEADPELSLGMPWYFDSVCVFSLLGPVYFAGLQAKRSDPTRETSHALERVATERIATDCPCTWFIRPGEQHQGLLVITSGIGMKRAHGSPIKEYESMQHRRLTHLFLKSTTCLVLVFSSQITLGSQWIFVLACCIARFFISRSFCTGWRQHFGPTHHHHHRHRNQSPNQWSLSTLVPRTGKTSRRQYLLPRQGLLFPLCPFLRVTFRKREMGVESLGLFFDPCIVRASICKCFDSSHLHHSWSWSYFISMCVWFWQVLFLFLCTLIWPCKASKNMMPHFNTLGLAPNSGAADIKKAYRKLALTLVLATICGTLEFTWSYMSIYIVYIYIHVVPHLLYIACFPNSSLSEYWGIIWDIV